MMERETFLVLDMVAPKARVEEDGETIEFTVNVRDIVSYELGTMDGAKTLLTVKEPRGPVWIVQTPQVIQQMLIETGCMLCIRTEKG